MKLVNRKTGEIGYLITGRGSEHYVVANDEWRTCGEYASLAELSSEWEDMPEKPKLRWYIDLSCNDIRIYENVCLPEELVDKLKAIGNYFSSREEAELAIRRLKAWKRLKDKGFRFLSYYDNVADVGKIYAEFPKDDPYGNVHNDLDLLFGGEE